MTSVTWSRVYRTSSPQRYALSGCAKSSVHRAVSSPHWVVPNFSRNRSITAFVLAYAGRGAVPVGSVLPCTNPTAIAAEHRQPHRFLDRATPPPKDVAALINSSGISWPCSLSPRSTACAQLYFPVIKRRTAVSCRCLSVKRCLQRIKYVAADPLAWPRYAEDEVRVKLDVCKGVAGNYPWEASGR